ncbi:unnamed protein product [Pedinophyceae sp. YPF-701]|nr:unnamed protein product [Pedinophyceae sp. YPF-701]
MGKSSKRNRSARSSAKSKSRGSSGPTKQYKSLMADDPVAESASNGATGAVGGPDGGVHAAAGSSKGESSPDISRVFVVRAIVKASGTHRPTVILAGDLVSLTGPDISAAASTDPAVVRPLFLGFHNDDAEPGADGSSAESASARVLGSDLQLTLRYEPPSAQFSRHAEGKSSYRVTLSAGGAAPGEFLGAFRGLESTLRKDEKGGLVLWGGLHLLLPSSEQVATLSDALKHVEVQSADLSAWGRVCASAQEAARCATESAGDTPAASWTHPPPQSSASTIPEKVPATRTWTEWAKGWQEWMRTPAGAAATAAGAVIAVAGASAVVAHVVGARARRAG